MDTTARSAGVSVERSSNALGTLLAIAMVLLADASALEALLAAASLTLPAILEIAIFLAASSWVFSAELPTLPNLETKPTPAPTAMSVNPTAKSAHPAQQSADLHGQLDLKIVVKDRMGK